jgi:hypothetical protein
VFLLRLAAAAAILSLSHLDLDGLASADLLSAPKLGLSAVHL